MYKMQNKKDAGGPGSPVRRAGVQLGVVKKNMAGSRWLCYARANRGSVAGGRASSLEVPSGRSRVCVSSCAVAGAGKLTSQRNASAASE